MKTLPPGAWERNPLISHLCLSMLQKLVGATELFHFNLCVDNDTSSLVKTERQCHRLPILKTVNSSFLLQFLVDGSQAPAFAMTPFSLRPLDLACCSFYSLKHILFLSLGPSNYKAKFEDFSLFWHTGWWLKIQFSPSGYLINKTLSFVRIPSVAVLNN